MPLPIGTWNANLNRSLSTLVIQTTDASGNVAGMIGGVSFSGSWDEITQRLNLYTSGQPKVFTAYLFKDRFRMPGIVGGTVFTLAGHFTDFSVSDVDKPTFGWYAQIGLP